MVIPALPLLTFSRALQKLHIELDMAEGGISKSELVCRDPPCRTQSESDTPNPNPTSRPAMARLSSYTFSHEKKLFQGRNTKKQWMFAVKKTRALVDPWGEMGIDSLPEQVVTRHMYNPRTRKWKSDEIVVKMQTESFAHGAMRECFRMKKLSKFSQHPDWLNASNYVAKRYMKEASRETYFEDVKLQMDSKLWGEEYNKLEVVPKKVDFFQTYIIEFKGQEGSPLHGVEHFIEGGYVKYNSNSGFVSDLNRLTPQTFSHFTFERSDHQLIVVDIQGVGDLYTDPQMHTVDQKDYGEANLGVRGMALFFSSHVCSPLCQALGLTQFDLNVKEMDNLRSKRWNFSTPATKIIDREVPDSEAKTKEGHLPRETVEEAFHRLSVSINIENLKNTKTKTTEIAPESPLPLDSPLDSPLVTGTLLSTVEPHPLMITLPSARIQEIRGGESFPMRSRSDSQCSNDSIDYDSCLINDLETYPISQEEAVFEGRSKEESGAEKILHSSSAEGERTRLREEGAVSSTETDALKILGIIHLDLARLHESGRFVSDLSPVDQNAVQFHLERAAKCGNVVALYTLAHIHLQHPHQEFQDISVEATPENEAVGMEHLLAAAKRNLKPAMFELAKALDTGLYTRDPNWSEAALWYHKVLEYELASDSEAESMSTVDPDYLVQARLAGLYRTGGNGLTKHSQKSGDLYTEAAEAAMSAMKGKLSTKYFMLAEEAWGEMDND